MPYTNNNFQNKNMWETHNPVLQSFYNKDQDPVTEAFLNMQNSPSAYQPPKATTFMEGVKSGGQQLANDLKYFIAKFQKEAAGEDYFKSAINSLQNSFQGGLEEQSVETLKSKMREIENKNAPIPFPAMSPTHAVSLYQAPSRESSVEYDILKKLADMKKKGHNATYIKSWLDNLYNYGGEASKRLEEVLQEGQQIPQPEGWGLVGNASVGLLDFIVPVAASAVSPIAGFALSGLSLAKGIMQDQAATNKEIDYYERATNQKVSDSERRAYVWGVTATDMLLGGIMQSRYLKNIDIPLVGKLRKSLFKKMFSSPQSMREFNTLFKSSLKSNAPKFLKQSGRMAMEQAGASTASGITRNMLGLIYKNPEHYPTLNEIMKEVTTEAVYGATTGFVTGGVSTGLGAMKSPKRFQSKSTPNQMGLPPKSIFDAEGLTIQGYRDREEKIRRILTENVKPIELSMENIPERNRLPLSEQYRVKGLPENSMFDVGNLSLSEYNEIVPQLRSALREYYLPKPLQTDILPDQNRLPLSERYHLDLPDNMLYDLEGLSLTDWLEREERIKNILQDRYRPTRPLRPIDGSSQFDASYNPLSDFEGLTLQGYKDREEKIRRILTENVKPFKLSTENLPEQNRLPLSYEYELRGLPNNPMFDAGNLTLQEYNEIVPQLRGALREYYQPKPREVDNIPGQNRLPLSEQYHLDLPDNMLYDLEGLSLTDWMNRENKIKNILQDRYQPRYLDLSEEPNIWRGAKVGEYSNSLRRSEVKEMGDKLNIKARMYSDIGDIPMEYKKYLDDYSRSKGFYNPETDEVVVIGNNITSQSDLQNLLIQKGYETKGLKGVLGDELDNLLDDVYNNMSNKESRKYSRRGDSSKTVALNYISDLSKNPDINPNEWTRLSSYVRDLFKNKYNVDVSDRTISNLLWRTANQITGDDTIEEMIRKSR